MGASRDLSDPDSSVWSGIDVIHICFEYIGALVFTEPQRVVSVSCHLSHSVDAIRAVASASASIETFGVAYHIYASWFCSESALLSISKSWKVDGVDPTFAACPLTASMQQPRWTRMRTQQEEHQSCLQEEKNQQLQSA